MMDDDQLGSRLREQVDVELGDLTTPPGSRERLRRGLRKRRRSPWFRASILVPVATALAIAGLVLAIPALLNRDEGVKVAPAGPAPISTTVDQPVPTAVPRKTATPERTTASRRPKPTTRESIPTRAEEPTARATAEPSARKDSDAATATRNESARTTPTIAPTPSVNGK